MRSRHHAGVGTLAVLLTGLAWITASCGGDEFTQSATGGAGGADASVAGSSGAQSGGSAGSHAGAAGVGGGAQGGATGQGGSANGGAAGQGGSELGGASGDGGSSVGGSGTGGVSTGGNGQGGSGANTGEGGSGASTGEGGSAGAGGGTTCNFDGCVLHTTPGADADCNPCVASVCTLSPGCCASGNAWGPYCVFVAHTLAVCECGLLKCTPGANASGTGGACIPAGAPCNPLGPSLCGVGTSCTFSTETTPHFQCTATGSQTGCGACGGTNPCAAGMSCIFNKCVFPCCTDADCGTGAFCRNGLLLPGSDALGICMTPASSTTSL